MGRAARHIDGQVIMYADRVTGSMQRAIAETKRRRKLQAAFNKKHNIKPQSISKEIRATYFKDRQGEIAEEIDVAEIPKEEIERAIKDLTNKMQLAAQNLEFERAARLRDTIQALRQEEKTTRSSE